MKTLIAVLLTVFAVEVSAQSIWTTPLRITSGNQNDIHPTIADGNGWRSSVEREMLAFSRDGKNIGILQSALLLGREVATLVNESKTPGTYAVEWNAGSLTGGVYFYRLQSGGFSETKRMLLVK